MAVASDHQRSAIQSDSGIDGPAARERLLQADDAGQQGYALFDNSDRLVYCNRRYRSLCDPFADRLVAGIDFRQICAAAWDSGFYADIGLSREGWLEARLRHFRVFDGPYRVALADGRWLQVDERPAPDGGVVLTVDDMDGWDPIDALFQRNGVRLADLLNSLPALVYLIDRNGRYLYANRNFKALNDLADNDIVGKTDFELFRAEDADSYWRTDQVVIKTGEPLETFEYAELPDGLHTYLTRKFPLLAADGHCLGVGHCSIDMTSMTDRMGREQEIQRRFLTAIDATSEAIALFDADDRLMAFNRKFREIQGPLAETIEPGLHMKDLVDAQLAAGLIAEAKGREQEWRRQRMDRYYRSDAPFDQMRREDLWLNLRGQRMPDGSRISVITDITERKRIEEALRRSDQLKSTILASALDSIVTIDANGIVLDFNPAAERVFGYSRADILGRNIADLIIPEHLRERHRAALKRFVETGEGRVIGARIELTALHADGHEFPVEISVAPTYQDDRASFTAFIRDISQQKVAEERLRQSQKMEAVGQLTGGIAHDFNNLLAVVLGNLDLVLEHLSDRDERHDLVSRAIKAAERGATLTQRLLAFSRKQPLHPKTIQLNSLVAGMDELLRRSLGEHIEIELVTAAGLWFCEVDPSQMEIALLNLAINARDAMVEGGKLTIETANARLDDDYAAVQADLPPGQYVMLAVTDTGCGMSAEVKEQIFQPFFTTKQVGQGSGLGLSMVYGFVKQSGGHIAVYSEPSEGSTFKIYLPRVQSDCAPEDLEPVPAGTQSGRRDRILVVEDSGDVRDLIVTLLLRAGYRVLAAADGEAALRLLDSAEGVDLLLTDAVLPGGLSGRDLADAVRHRSPETRILFMSGYTENAIVHHGRLDEDVLLLQKPFRESDLTRKVRQALEGQGRRS